MCKLHIVTGPFRRYNVDSTSERVTPKVSANGVFWGADFVKTLYNYLL